MTTVRLIGVPSSAGAHAPGVERGPAHLRRAGIARALSDAGLSVVDGADVAPRRFATAATTSGARNLPAVLEVVREVAARVADARRHGQLPVLLGGDCTLAVGAVLGLRHTGHQRDQVGVFYLDGDADLDTPQEGWGVLDSCGVAHLLGDGDPDLAGVLPGGPLLADDGVVLFGFHPAQLSPPQRRRFTERHLRGVPVTEIPAGQAGHLAAEAALALSGREAVLLHLDVDVIDFPSFPLADCPRYHAGLALADAMDAVRAVAGHPRLAALSITEVNPDHDPGGELTQTLASAWAAAVGAAITGPPTAGPAR